MKLVNNILELRSPEMSDAATLFCLRTDPIVNKFVDRNTPKNISDAEKFIEQRLLDINGFYFIITILPGHDVVGAICLWNINEENKYAEVGYELLPEFQGKGIMTNALHEIINFAFSKLNINVIEALTHKNNMASRSLLKRLNFQLVSGKSDPDNLNNLIYSLCKCDCTHSINFSETIIQ